MISDKCAIKKLATRDQNFDQTLSDLIAWDMVSDTAVEDAAIKAIGQFN